MSEMQLWCNEGLGEGSWMDPCIKGGKSLLCFPRFEININRRAHTAFLHLPARDRTSCHLEEQWSAQWDKDSDICNTGARRADSLTLLEVEVWMKRGRSRWYIQWGLKNHGGLIMDREKEGLTRHSCWNQGGHKSRTCLQEHKQAILVAAG